MTAPTTTTLETWTIDASHTHVGFAVRHMMVATAKGTFTDVKGTVEFDGANLATAKINVEIAAASIDTKTAHRDNHLKPPAADSIAALMHKPQAPLFSAKGGDEKIARRAAWDIIPKVLQRRLKILILGYNYAELQETPRYPL